MEHCGFPQHLIDNIDNWAMCNPLLGTFDLTKTADEIGLNHGSLIWVTEKHDACDPPVFFAAEPPPPNIHRRRASRLPRWLT